jgi:hypothetical protein
MGEAGTGKTVLACKTIFRYVAVGIIVGCCAVSWEASFLLPTACSLHRIFGIRPHGDPDLTDDRVHYLRSLQLLWIDEVFLGLYGWLKECESIARSVRGNDKPWGGIITVFSGCCSQIAPVIATASTPLAIGTEEGFGVVPKKLLCVL